MTIRHAYSQCNLLSNDRLSFFESDNACSDGLAATPITANRVRDQAPPRWRTPLTCSLNVGRPSSRPRPSFLAPHLALVRDSQSVLSTAITATPPRAAVGLSVDALTAGDRA